MKLSEIHINPNNPRLIKDERFKKLVKSISDFPKMMELRPIIVDENEYRIINGYDGYLFSSDGKVISFKKSCREIHGSPNKDGYLKITLVDNEGNCHYFRKHRLIAKAFFGENILDVNHKDLNKRNCAVDNLEYVTGQENQCHRRLNEGFGIGVCWDKKSRKWRAYLQNEKKWEHLGFFDTKEKAKDAYINRLRELQIQNKYAKQN